eukprot:757439-Hanusia_phi.AAC.1
MKSSVSVGGAAGGRNESRCGKRGKRVGDQEKVRGERRRQGVIVQESQAWRLNVYRGRIQQSCDRSLSCKETTTSGGEER